MATTKRRRTKSSSSPPRPKTRGRSGSAPARLRKPVARIDRRFFKKLGLLSNRLMGKIKKDIISIESANKNYSAFFMENDKGRVLLVSNLSKSDPDAISELTSDIKQIYDTDTNGREEKENILPETLIINTDGNAEGIARAKDAVRRLAVYANIGRGDGNEYKISEPSEDKVDGTSLSLVFNTQLVAAAKKTNIAARQQENAPTDKGKEEEASETDSSDDGIPVKENDGADNLRRSLRQEDVIDDDDESVADEQGPDVSRLYAPPAQPVAKLMTVEQFKEKATGFFQNRNADRTPGYNNLVNSLGTYHGELNKIRNEAEATKQKIAAIGKNKVDNQKELLSALKQKKDNEKQLFGNRIQLETNMSELARLWTEQAAESDSDKKEQLSKDTDSLQKATQKLATDNRDLADNLKLLETQITTITQDISKIDSDLVDSINEKNRQFVDTQDALDKHADDLRQAVSDYQREKSSSGSRSKKEALNDLANQLAKPSDLEHHKRVIESVWSAPLGAQLASPLKLLNTGTASEVFRAETNTALGSSGLNEGFAKRGMEKGEQASETTFILRYKDKNNVLSEKPNLIARQVISSRIDKFMGTNVVANEAFSADLDGNALGVTARAIGKQVMQNQNTELFLFQGNVEDSIQIYNHFNYKDGRIQKGLSDLQLIDALTNQMDRHLGNIFIDPHTGKVTGIDNDMAFHMYQKDAYLGYTNTLHMFDTVETKKGQKELVYLQEQVSKSTAEKFLKMTEQDLLKMLDGREGDPEKLEPVAKENTLIRFRAMQKKIKQLKKDKKLIPDDGWGPKTYNDAMAGGTKELFNGPADLNYIYRAEKGYEKAADPNNKISRQGLY